MHLQNPSRMPSSTRRPIPRLSRPRPTHGIQSQGRRLGDEQRWAAFALSCARSSSASGLVSSVARPWNSAGSLYATPSYVPDGAVLLSMVDNVQAPLRRLSFARVRESRCLMDRLVSLCWNHSDAYGRCVHSALILPGEPEPELIYHLKCWAKWSLLHEALRVARTALYIDADVILLRNPFATPSGARFASGPCAAESQLLYQFEGPGSNRKSGTPPPVLGTSAAPHPPATVEPPRHASFAALNSGQMLACSAAVVERVLSSMPRALSEARLPAGGVHLDQARPRPAEQRHTTAPTARARSPADCGPAAHRGPARQAPANDPPGVNRQGAGASARRALQVPQLHLAQCAAPSSVMQPSHRKRSMHATNTHCHSSQLGERAKISHTPSSAR